MFRRILRKVKKISITVLSVIRLSVIILPFLAALSLNVESVQNFAVRKAGSIITETLGTQVSMERIKIRGFSKLEAKGFYVQDLAGDTLIYAGTLTGNISKTALTRRKLIIGDITLEDGRIYLHKPENGDMNIQEVLDTFLDRDRERKGRTDILLRDIYISGTRFKLQIDGRDSIASDRMNFGNLIFDGLTVGSHNLAIKGQRISMNLYGMSFTDVSGFKVDLLETEEFVIDQGLLDFTNTSIKTPDSYLTLPDIKLDGYGNWKRFSSFTDSVRMDVALNNSDVHSRTLSYIIPWIPRQADIMLNGADLTFTGTVNDFNGELKNIVTGGTRLHGTYAVKGVTDIKKAWFDLDIPSLSTDAFRLENLAYEFLSQEPDTAIINMLHRAGNMEMALTAVAEMNNFDADLNLSSPLGGIAAKAEISSAVNNGIKFDGTVEVEGFELGRLLATNTLGERYVNGKLSGTVSNGKIDAQRNGRVPSIQCNANNNRNSW